ncbi:MAG: C40 family peptidase [Clostridiales bacterium]|nr:C40 family peptidase [Clostridiales bacterium]
MGKAIVKTDIAPLHDKPRGDSTLVDEALFGMVVETLGQAENGFVRARTPYRYEGFVPMKCLLTDEREADRWQSAPKWTVWAPYLDVKAEPRVQAPALAYCTRGGVLENPGADAPPPDGWTEVRLPGGQAGFARTPCLAPQKPDWSAVRETEMREALVRTARTYLGVQYRWGGKTPLGIDCSGLTSISYWLNGCAIYRDADIREGFAMCEIPFAKKQKGDLVFFKRHVAMYIGQDEFIHSTAYARSEGVVINSFHPASPIFRKDLLETIVKTGSIF